MFPKKKTPPPPDPRFVRNGFDLLGGYNKQKLMSLMHLDPLFGAEFPVYNMDREIIDEDEETDIGENNEEKYMYPEWENYIMDFEEALMTGLTAGALYGLVSGLGITAGNICIAASGVVAIPVFLGQKKVFPSVSQYAMYALKRLFNRTEKNWYKLTAIADKMNIPKSKAAIKTAPIYKHSQKIFLKELQGNKEYYTKKASEEVKEAFFAPLWFRLKSKENVRWSWLRVSKYFQNHPLRKFSREYRLEQKLPPDALVPLSVYLNGFVQLYLPKRFYIYSIIKSYLRWFYLHMRRVTFQGPYFFIILSFHIYFWQHLSRFFTKKNRALVRYQKGFFLTGAFITGCWNFWWFMGSLFGRAPFLTIPLKHIPGALIGYVGLSYIISSWLMSFENPSQQEEKLIMNEEGQMDPPVVYPWRKIFQDYKKKLTNRKRELKDHFENNAPLITPTVAGSVLEMGNKYDPYIRRSNRAIKELEALIEEIESDENFYNDDDDDDDDGPTKRVITRDPNQEDIG